MLWYHTENENTCADAVCDTSQTNNQKDKTQCCDSKIFDLEMRGKTLKRKRVNMRFSRLLAGKIIKGLISNPVYVRNSCGADIENHTGWISLGDGTFGTPG